MIDERDVRFGDVFVWPAGDRRIMFVAWDDSMPPSDEGRYWWGLDLLLGNNAGKPASRRGFKAETSSGGWTLAGWMWIK